MLPPVLEEVLPKAWHRMERYANNRIEADDAQLKRRLRPMRGLKTDVSTRIVIAGLAFMHNIAVATTNSPLMDHRSYVSRWSSMSSLKQSDPDQQTSSWRFRCDLLFPAGHQPKDAPTLDVDVDCIHKIGVRPQVMSRPYWRPGSGQCSPRPSVNFR